MIPDGSGYLHAMTMEDISDMQHSYNVNSTALIDRMIDHATNTLSNKAKPFNCTETVGEQEIFVATQEEIDAMVSNIPTPKAKQNKLIPMVLLLMQTINGITTNRPLVALLDTRSSHCLFNKAAQPFGAPLIQTDPIQTTTTQGTYQCNEAVLMSNLLLPEFVNGRKNYKRYCSSL